MVRLLIFAACCLPLCLARVSADSLDPVVREFSDDELAAAKTACAGLTEEPKDPITGK